MLATLASIFAGIVAGIIGEIGFLAIIIAYGYGPLAGATIMRAAGMKRGLMLEILAGSGMATGVLALKLLPAALFGQAHYSAISFGLVSLLDPLFWVAVAIAIARAVMRIRYI